MATRTKVRFVRMLSSAPSLIAHCSSFSRLTTAILNAKFEIYTIHIYTCSLPEQRVTYDRSLTRCYRFALMLRLFHILASSLLFYTPAVTETQERVTYNGVVLKFITSPKRAGKETWLSSLAPHSTILYPIRVVQFYSGGEKEDTMLSGCCYPDNGQL